MPNYSLTTTAQFQPFSLERYLQPYQAYNEEFKLQEAALAQMEEQALTLYDKIGNNPNDEALRRQYSQYLQDLETQAQALAEGLNASSRPTLYNMKKRYTKEIKPIEEAYIARNQEIAEQVKGEQAGFMYEQDARYAPLSNYLHNPNNRFKSVNVDYQYKKLSEEASILAKKLFNAIKIGRVDEFNKSLTQEYGYTPAQAKSIIDTTRDIIKNNGDISKIESNVLSDLLYKNMQSTGVLNWSPEKQQEYFDRVSPAIYKAVGETKFNIFGDERAKSDLDYTRALAVENYKRSLDNTAPEFPKIPIGVEGEASELQNKIEGLVEGPNGTFNNNEIATAQLKYRQAVDKYNQLVKKNNWTEDDINRFKMAQAEAENNKRRKSTPGASSYGNLGEAMNDLSKKTGRNFEYERAVEAIKAAEKERDAVENYYLDLENKYYHLGNTPYERVLTGLQLEIGQAKQQSYMLQYNKKPETSEKVMKGITNSILSSGEESINKGNTKFVDLEGNSLDYEETNTLFEAIKEGIGKAQLGIYNRGNNIFLTVTYDGKHYIPQGIQQIDNFNNNINSINNYLKDFSKESVKNAALIDDETYNNIATQGLQNTPIKTKLLFTSIPGTLYKGAVIKTSDNNYFKLILDDSNNIIAYNALSTELNGGALRDSQITSFSNTFLNSLESTFANK